MHRSMDFSILILVRFFVFFKKKHSLESFFVEDIQIKHVQKNIMSYYPLQLYPYRVVWIKGSHSSSCLCSTLLLG